MTHPWHIFGTLLADELVELMDRLCDGGLRRLHVGKDFASQTGGEG